MTKYDLPVAIVAVVIAVLVGVLLMVVNLITCCILYRTKKDLRVLSKFEGGERERERERERE